MTYIGDGGQSTGVTYEALNFAAVQRLGLVLWVENNCFAYSTPTSEQFTVSDLAERSIAYNIPGVIVDGTDACQVYDAAHEGCERARRGEGPTMIEAKMMRMNGHGIHDPFSYVPRPLLDFFKRRDPLTRFENYLLNSTGWLSKKDNLELIREVHSEIDEARALAAVAPMPDASQVANGVYCESCHDITFKYGTPRYPSERLSIKNKTLRTENPHFS